MKNKQSEWRLDVIVNADLLVEYMEYNDMVRPRTGIEGEVLPLHHRPLPNWQAKALPAEPGEADRQGASSPQEGPFLCLNRCVSRVTNDNWFRHEGTKKPALLQEDGRGNHQSEGKANARKGYHS